MPSPISFPLSIPCVHRHSTSSIGHGPIETFMHSVESVQSAILTITVILPISAIFSSRSIPSFVWIKGSRQSNPYYLCLESLPFRSDPSKNCFLNSNHSGRLQIYVFIDRWFPYYSGSYHLLLGKFLALQIYVLTIAIMLLDTYKSQITPNESKTVTNKLQNWFL